MDGVFKALAMGAPCTKAVCMGARCFNVPAITRRELMSLTHECAEVTGIPYLMDAYRSEAEEILSK